MQSNLTEGTGRQRSANRYDHGRVLDGDQAHGFRGTDHERVFIESGAAMAVGVGESGAAYGARGYPDQRNGLAWTEGLAAQVLNSGMSGLEPHAQNEVDLNGNLRGR